jgi:thioredoxin-like negative regulator of GroEL
MNLSSSTSSLREVDEDSFEAEVLRCPQPVLVFFQNPEKRYCQILQATLDEIAADGTGEVKIVKVNTGNNLILCAWQEVEFIPTLLYFVNGAVCERLVGMAEKTAILAKLNSALHHHRQPCCPK